MAKELKSWNYGGWRSYNNYAGSKSTVDDKEFPPPSMNVMLADRGSVKKSPGASRFGSEVNTGFPVLNGIQYTTDTFDYLIVHSGTVTKRYSSGSWVTMTGATFATNKPVYFCQALDNLYASQENDPNLYVSTNGSTWSVVTNGKGGITPVFYNARLYIIQGKFIWYSNPYSVTTSPSPSLSLGDFATFNTDLTTTPKKNAGFIQLVPGSGTYPSALFKDNETLYAYTERSGYFKITPDSEPLADGSISHSIIQANGYFGTRAPFSIKKVQNDQWFDDGEMLNSLGEVALYPTARVTPKYGAAKADLNSKNPAYPELPAVGIKDTVVYYAYPVGSYNDRVIAYDLILKGLSSTWSGYNCAFFMEYFDGTTKRLLYGSSNPSDSYLYEMGSGTTIGDTSVASVFEPKSTSCGFPGRVKRAGIARVYYTGLYGQVGYEVVLEENRSLTGNQLVGSSANSNFGLGINVLGYTMLGEDFDEDSTAGSISTNSYFDIDCEFEAFERITTRITNANAGENFQIDDIEYLFQLGNQFETLDENTLLTAAPSYDGDDELGTYI